MGLNAALFLAYYRAYYVPVMALFPQGVECCGNSLSLLLCEDLLQKSGL